MDADELLKTRIQRLGGGRATGKCVLYVMSRDQRVKDSHALLAAQKHALARKLPLAVVFCLYPKSGARAREHFEFMLAGLHGVEASLAKLNLPFILLVGPPEERLKGVFYHLKPDAVYFDFNPLRGPLTLQKKLAFKADFACYQVDTHNVVPVWAASDKAEIGARTLRPKIHRILADYLIEPEQLQKHLYTWKGPILALETLDEIIAESLKLVPSNGQTLKYKSGEEAAQTALQNFLKNRLKNYATDRNDPSRDGLSGLSPYLHFGHLSALRVAIEAMTAAAKQPALLPAADKLLEEMIVRKELSDNWCYYNPQYDQLAGTSQWAQNTLAKHASDEREFLYTLEEFEQASTHDRAWNAAQRQLLKTGKMHGYMRMYWAKKVLEWSSSPEAAIKILVYLNDFYSLDGGDPNGYVGIMWSVAGVHDRPWGERPVYGMIRSMVYGGLKRKFDIEKYITLC